MRWLDKAHARRTAASSPSFILPAVTSVNLVIGGGLVIGWALAFVICFIPTVLLSRRSTRAHRRRMAEYEARRGLFEAKGWGWDCV